MNLSAQIKARREALGITQTELAEAVAKKAGRKFSQQSLAKLEKKPESNSRFMVFILAALDDLERRHFPTQPNQHSNAAWGEDIHPWDQHTPLGDDEVEVRMFTEVEIQGGNGSSHAVEFNGPVLRFSKRTLAKANVPPEAAACAKVSGDSMSPVMPEGTTVGVNTADVAIKDGKVYAIDHHGHLRVKMLYRLPNRGLRIASYNKEEYPDEILSAGEFEDSVRIIGRVFWWSVLD